MYRIGQRGGGIYRIRARGVLYMDGPRGVTFYEFNSGGRHFAEHFTAVIRLFVQDQLMYLARAISYDEEE